MSSGASELFKILNILKTRGKPALRAQPDRRIIQIEGPSNIEVWSLSPSDECLERFMAYVAANMPKVGETKTRAPAIRANETAVALLIKVGEHAVLLGADLEETHKGWSAILASSGRPTEKSTLFKIPHHGSENGHHHDVWGNMLIPNPVALLTPYNRGTKLPRPSDINRIYQYTNKAFTTQTLSKPPKINRPSLIDKTIKELGLTLEPINKSSGHIRARIASETSDWEIELYNGASTL